MLRLGSKSVVSWYEARGVSPVSSFDGDVFHLEFCATAQHVLGLDDAMYANVYRKRCSKMNGAKIAEQEA